LQDAGYTDFRTLNRSACEDLRQQGVEVIQGDISDYSYVEKAVQGCDVVFHVAAKAGVWGSYKSYYKANVIGAENVVRACWKCGVTKLIYTSSPSVVFNGNSLCNVTEQIGYGSPLKMCAYAKTKALAEQYVLQANGQKGLKTVALRPHLIFGPGDNHLIPTLLKAAKKGLLAQVGDGQNWVDLSYVEDVAQAHVLAMKALENSESVAGKAYFISQGDPVQLWPWIQNLLGHLNLPKIRLKMPLSLALGLGAICEVIYKLLCIRKQPPMTRFVAKELAQSHYFDISAAKMDLHYLPKYSNEEAFEKLVNYLKK
jgi:nucleoside-diphosphate-sugar epimerase